jgi:hypothetical protein
MLQNRRLTLDRKVKVASLSNLMLLKSRVERCRSIGLLYSTITSVGCPQKVRLISAFLSSVVKHKVTKHFSYSRLAMVAHTSDFYLII